LWQTLILSQWQDIFSYLPVESLIYTHQDDYYLALQQSTKQANSVPFIEFILQMIPIDALSRGRHMNHFFAFHDTYTSVSILPHIINQTLH
jgi:Fic family protein